MCHCIIGECWWCNCFKECAGLAERLCCFGCWMCTPDDFPQDGKECCSCCEATGYGGNCCCYGGVCCAPEWLKGWAKSKGA